jgi:hypothetical protein
MVSDGASTRFLGPHSKGLNLVSFMGFYRQRVFGVYNPYNGTFSVTPTTTVPPKIEASRTVSGGLSSVLIGDLLSPEPFVPIVRSTH